MKRIVTSLAALGLCLCLGTSAFAESYGNNNWHVAFEANTDMTEDFDPSVNGSMSEVLRALQPGDDATFNVQIKNNHPETTDWYMTNKVLRSLEETENVVAGGGAYTYLLTYTGPSGTEEVLYNSDRVGGEEGPSDRIGLNQATISLEDFFYLDTLKTGETGMVSLHVSLEGETQGNAYQDTLAQLQVNFAVELPSSRKPRFFHSVKTGDESPILLWSVIMLACGLGALGLAVLNFRNNNRRRRHEK